MISRPRVPRVLRVFQTSSALGLTNPTVTATTHAFGSTGGSTLSTEPTQINPGSSTDGTPAGD